GNGFNISLTGTTTDGSTSCLGSASFNVVAHMTTQVTVHLTCHQAPTTGSISVNGTVNICPLIDGISANPGEAFVGAHIALASTAHDADGGPSPLSYSWSASPASGGTFSDPTSPSPSFACAAAGPVTLTLALSDGDPAAGCADHLQVLVTCTP